MISGWPSSSVFQSKANSGLLELLLTLLFPFTKPPLCLQFTDKKTRLGGAQCAQVVDLKFGPGSV